MKALLREQAVLLRRRDRLSYGEIKKRLNVSRSTLSAWLKDLPLTKEEILKLRRAQWTSTEASREKYRETMRQKRLVRQKLFYDKEDKRFKNITKRERYVAGLMLYVAEGAKYDDYAMTLTNTDPRLLSFFIGWVEEFFGVQRSKLRAQLHLYENMNIEAERCFWEKELRLERKQFYRTQIRKVFKNTYSYTAGFRHGTCQVSLCDTEKKRLLTESIRAFIDNCYVSKT